MCQPTDAMIQYMMVQVDRIIRTYRPTNVMIVYCDVLSSILFRYLPLEIWQPVALVGFIFLMITLSQSLCQYYRMHLILTSMLYAATHILSWNVFGTVATGDAEFQFLPIIAFIAIFFSLNGDFYQR